MTLQELNTWLQAQQPKLDNAIASAGRAYHQANGKPNFGYDLAECQLESFNRVDNKDLCYDRMNTAFAYSLWYHGRRINTFLTYFAKTILNCTDSQIEIFDLGAGTGAVQWAIGLVYHKMKDEGMIVPDIRIVNIDSSPFMLYYSRDYLWPAFKREYSHCKDFSNNIEYQINSWNNSENRTVSNPWITASYLFDISDTNPDGKINQEYRTSVKNGFRDLIRLFDPSNILLLTSDQPAKRNLLLELKSEFSKNGYISNEISSSGQILNGLLHETNQLRTELYNTYRADFEELPPRYSNSMSRRTVWTEGRFIGAVLTKQAQEIRFGDTSPRTKKKKIQLYNEPIKVRRNITLNEDQLRAAAHSNRPTIITGPAGCGKSVVITERLKNLVAEEQFSPSLNILVTTFNKQLLSYLGKWIEDLLNTLDSNKDSYRRQGNKFYFKESSTPNITMMWFDVLPTRLGIGLNILPVEYKEYHSRKIRECITEVKTERNITTNRHDKVLNPDYILDEYQRIIYGLQITKKDDYLNAERKGRPRLHVGGLRRELLWDVIVEKYMKRVMEGTIMDSFITKRHRFHRQIQRKEVNLKFTHIFVDEFQDCTYADYDIFYSLLNDPNKLVIAGDIAQAIQLGAVADIPRSEDDIMQRRVIFRLKGSYRLPFRISECITKISETIENGNIISPYKGSPPGARPIVVYASSSAEFKTKLQSIYETYGVYHLDKVTILEEDSEICRALKAVGTEAETDTILRLKGLEKSCVLWTTRKDIEYKGEIAEFVYTILSRTSGILIIVISSLTLSKYYKIINLLRPDRLILWDRETKEKFEEYRNNVDDEPDDDDEDE